MPSSNPMVQTRMRDRLSPPCMDVSIRLDDGTRYSRQLAGRSCPPGMSPQGDPCSLSGRPPHAVMAPHAGKAGPVVVVAPGAEDADGWCHDARTAADWRHTQTVNTRAASAKPAQ